MPTTADKLKEVAIAKQQRADSYKAPLETDPDKTTELHNVLALGFEADAKLLTRAAAEMEALEKLLEKANKRKRRYHDALGALWELVENRLSESEIERLEEKHDIFGQLQAFGKNGPCGIGLDNFGGHAIGE